MTQVELEYLRLFYTTNVMACKICEGSGVDCACQDLFNLERKMVAAHIPQKYRRLSMTDVTAPDLQPIKKVVELYIANIVPNVEAGNGLFLWSKKTGTGKTMLGCEVLKAALRERKTAYFTDLTECVDLIVGGWRDSHAKDEFEQTMVNTDVLMIDDIGGMEIKTKSKSSEDAAGVSPIVESTFTRLFKQRANNLKATIMTSNLSNKQIEKAYGNRLHSALLEHMKFLEFTNKVDARETKQDAIVEKLKEDLSG